MAQSGFTPLLIYGSTTPSNSPSAGNLTTSASGVELAVNAADGKMFYKDHLGAVQVLATKDAAGGVFTTLSVSSTATLSGLTASTALALDASKNIVSVTNTGTGNNVLATSPTLTTPNIGAATATSVNKVAITAPASSATLTIADGKTLTANNSLTFAGTDATTFTMPANSGTVVTLAETQTLTNKRMTARVSSTASISSPLAWNSDNFDQYAATAQSGALTINADAGTPTDGQRVIFRFKDDGTARALTWTTGVSNGFQEIGVALPTTTVANKTTYVGAIYNASSSRWDVVATTTEA